MAAIWLTRRAELQHPVRGGRVGKTGIDRRPLPRATQEQRSHSQESQTQKSPPPAEPEGRGPAAGAVTVVHEKNLGAERDRCLKYWANL